MLKFLTHKLRTHSLNEESVSDKVEERDSGTESDDEADRPDDGDFCTDVIMKWNDVTDLKGMGGSGSGACACGGSPPPPAAAALPPPPEPDLLYDHHSSEEELEVINGSREGEASPAGPGAGAEAGEETGATPSALAARLESRRRAASSPPTSSGGGKRKWPRSPHIHTQHDDDDDDHKVETPVRFRTSPPLEALKPRRNLPHPHPLLHPLPHTGCMSAGAGAAPSSPGGSLRALERRRRVALPPRRHRPALDFDKMQQLRVGGSSVSGVRSWRGVGGVGMGVGVGAVGQGSGGELSVFCW